MADAIGANATQASGTNGQTSTLAGHSYGSTARPPSQPASSAVLRQNSVEMVLAMSKGEGVDSYSKNSGYQAIVNRITRLALGEALGKLALPSSPVVVADLGSSSGPNSIDNVDFIVEKLRTRSPQDAEFQVYFNDLPSNDFNNLFQLLCSRDKSFFAAGVAGSFFGRLFPRSSVHVFYSSFCLHWMSQVPDAILDKDSPAYNAGQSWITHPRTAVAKAYEEQASLDLQSFLRARAAELVSGGLLFFSAVGRSTSEPNEPEDDIIGQFLVIFQEIWNGLIAEGLLTEEQRDTFNIPCFMRGEKDLREAVESCGSLFQVLTTRVHTLQLSATEVFQESDATALAQKMTRFPRALVNNLLEAHLGENITEVIWQRYQKMAEKIVTAKTPQGIKINNSICIVSLIRK